MSDLALRLIETIPRVRQMLVVRLRRRDIHPSIPQLQVLALLLERPSTMSDLATLQGVTKATMSATLSRMAEQGLVHRRRTSSDRRQVLLRPTARGRAAFQAAQRGAEAILDEIVGCLTVPEKEALLQGIHLLMSAVERSSADTP